MDNAVGDSSESGLGGSGGALRYGSVRASSPGKTQPGVLRSPDGCPLRLGNQRGLPLFLQSVRVRSQLRFGRQPYRNVRVLLVLGSLKFVCEQ